MLSLPVQVETKVIILTLAGWQDARFSYIRLPLRLGVISCLRNMANAGCKNRRMLLSLKS